MASDYQLALVRPGISPERLGHSSLRLRTSAGMLRIASAPVRTGRAEDVRVTALDWRPRTTAERAVLVGAELKFTTGFTGTKPMPASRTKILVQSEGRTSPTARPACRESTTAVMRSGR